MVFSAFVLFPIWIIVFVFLLIITLSIFWLWAIISCLTSKLGIPEKLFWLVIIFLFNIIGALLYLIFSDMGRKSIMKSKNLKGKRIFRSRKNKMIAGVCGGIGEYLGIDPTVIRLLWVLSIFFSFGTAILAYIIAWVIIPEKK